MAQLNSPVKLRLILKNKGRVVYSITSTKKRSIYANLQEHKFSNGEIIVTYRSGWWNAAHFTTPKEFKTAFAPMIEQELVNYVNS